MLYDHGNIGYNNDDFPNCYPRRKFKKNAKHVIKRYFFSVSDRSKENDAHSVADFVIGADFDSRRRRQQGKQ